MNIRRDASIERHVLDSCKASFGEERTGVHLSDLLQPRQSYWKRTLPMPLTDSEVQYFLAGRGHEDALGRVAGLVVTPQAEVDGISMRPDFTLSLASADPDPRTRDEVPGEMKTRRSNLAKPGEEAIVYKSYLDQLRGYCALKGVSRGVLIVFSLLEGRSGDPLNPTHPELATYVVDFTEAELAQTRERLASLKDKFLSALASQDPSDLPLCDAWLCGKPRKHVEQQGECVECGPLSEPWLSKHPDTKKGAGHTIRPEVATWKFEPRCKWYFVCRPWDVDPLRGER